MPRYVVKHYDVKMTVCSDSFPGCCGAKTLYSFTVQGSTDKLTVKQKQDMYTHLFRELLPLQSGVLISADCVLQDLDDVQLNGGESRGGGTESSSWVLEDNSSCGDISLEDFCTYMGFTRQTIGRNSNSGNLIGCFSLAVINDSGVKLAPEMPTFDDEEKAPADADNKKAAIIEALRSAIASAAA